MALRDEQADILGGPILQKPESIYTAFSQYYIVFKSITILGLGLLVWVACARGFEYLQKHRELRYRKAMRRKHGIPDSDCRPFAVAYAAAKRARLEREAQDRKKSTNHVSNHNLPPVDQQTNAQKDVRALRRRLPETTVNLHDYQPSEKHAAVFDNKRPEFHPLDFASRYNPNPRRVAIPEPLSFEGPLRARAGKKDLILHLDDTEESRKRSFEEEDDTERETTKKSRIDGNGFVDGDEQADWYDQYSDMPPRRSSKEFPDRQTDCICAQGSGRERSKNTCDEDHESVDEVMEGIDDGMTELKAVVRGKKRDRAEAGSTFGGDDDEDIPNGRISHHRKRRTVSRRGFEISTRGQKRDRETESPGSEDEGGSSETSRRRAPRSSKKKRGRSDASGEASEISLRGPPVSKDPLCGSRRVGDEWEADGIHYKVGDKGERLRLTLVKKARNKYLMPQDSQHPDRSAALEIYVEAWMTEEQYKQAEGKLELAWQELSREPNGPKFADVLHSPPKNGKNLLWDSVKGSPARRPLRQLMSTEASTRINPFEQWQLQPTLGRRVASSSTIIAPMPVASPTRLGSRGFSKWEKQDREAEAMARIRAKMEEQRKPREPPQKPADVSTSVTTPGLVTQPLSVPTITLTPAPAVTAEDHLDSTRQGTSDTPTFSFATSSTSDSTKGAAASASAPSTAPGFSLPSTSSASPSFIHLPGASTTPTSVSSTASPSLSFAKPMQAPPSTSTTAAPSTMPIIFGKGINATAPSSHLPSTLGTPTQPPLPSTAGSSAPALFTFAKPNTSSVPSPPAVAPGTIKSQTSIFGISSSSPSSAVTFGSIPPVTKAEAPMPPVSTSTVTAENSKATAPLFSFSAPSSSSPSAPKFSFGQAPTSSIVTAGSNPPPSTASQPKPTFKFGPTPSSVMDGASVTKIPVVDELRGSAVSNSILGNTGGSGEPTKFVPFETLPSFGGSISGPPISVANPAGKTSVADGDSSTPAAAKPTTTSNGAWTSIPVSASNNTPTFSFAVADSGTKSTEGSKPISLFGGSTGSKPLSAFGGSSSESKPTFTFAAPAEKSTSIPGGNKDFLKTPIAFGGPTEGSKPAFMFGGSTETSNLPSVFGGGVGGVKPTFAFNGAAKSSEPASFTDTFKPASNVPSTAFGSSTLTSLFGKKEEMAAANAPNSANSMPAASLTFGASSSATGSVHGQPLLPTTSGDSSQTTFGKSTIVLPSSFGFVGTGGSSSSSTFTFGKPTTQNQNQEQ